MTKYILGNFRKPLLGGKKVRKNARPETILKTAMKEINAGDANMPAYNKLAVALHHLRTS